MAKKTHNPELNPDETHYCTQCGSELENYFLDESAADLSATTEHHHTCRKTGKFKGDMCARVFISEPVDPETLGDDD